MYILFSLFLNDYNSIIDVQYTIEIGNKPTNRQIDKPTKPINR